MPSMAMEPLGGASRYSSFARSMPIGATPAQRKRQQELAEIERLQEERVSLVQRASTVTKIADIMVEQNERMLAGLRAVARTSSDSPPPTVDFIARNVANVSAHSSGISRRDQALMARAEVMAAATAHLGGSGVPTSRAPPLANHQAHTKHGDNSDELLRLVRASAQPNAKSREPDLTFRDSIRAVSRHARRLSAAWTSPPLRCRRGDGQQSAEVCRRAQQSHTGAAPRPTRRPAAARAPRDRAAAAPRRTVPWTQMLDLSTPL